MPDPDRMPLLNKMWALFMSDPVSFITIVLPPIGALIWLAWLVRGFFEKKHRDTVDAQLKLANDKEKVLAEKLETAKKESQELKENVAQFAPKDTNVVVNITLADLLTAAA